MKDLNSILKHLNSASKTFVNDAVLMDHCNIDKDLYFAYKSELYTEKYIDGGKGMCAITEKGKLFILSGGYKKENKIDLNIKIAIIGVFVAIIAILCSIYPQEVRKLISTIKW